MCLADTARERNPITAAMLFSFSRKLCHDWDSVNDREYISQSDRLLIVESVLRNMPMSGITPDAHMCLVLMITARINSDTLFSITPAVPTCIFSCLLPVPTQTPYVAQH